MQVLLIKDVDNLGYAGDVKKLPAGTDATICCRRG